MAATKQKETQLSESLIPTNNNIQKLFYSVVSAYSDVIFTIPSLKERQRIFLSKTLNINTILNNSENVNSDSTVVIALRIRLCGWKSGSLIHVKYFLTTTKEKSQKIPDQEVYKIHNLEGLSYITIWIRWIFNSQLGNLMRK